MAAPPRIAPVPTPPGRTRSGGVVRGLTVVALLAFLVMTAAVTYLAVSLIDTQQDVDRAAERFERSSRDLDPAIQELREAARALRQAGRAVTP